jgi:hypothetical protein
MNTDRTLRICALNDDARRNLADGTMFFSRGVAALSVADQAAIVDRVCAFEDFTEDNDPWGEHDFGSFEHNGGTIFWKIDCYDHDLRCGSPDPADLAVTRRVLTILLADEY